MVFPRCCSLSLTGVLCTAAAVGPGAGAERAGTAPGKGESLGWHMDEAAAVKALLATPGAGVAVRPDGIRGHCLVFDGSRGRVEARDFPAVNLCAQGTMAAWVRIHGRCQGPRLAIACQPKADGTAWCLYAFSAAPASGLNLQIGVELDRDGKSRVRRTAGPRLTHGLWYHVAVTVGQGAVRIFTDGVKVLEAPDSGSPGTGEAALIIGNDAAGASPFRGAMDELTVFERALSEAEVAALYREQLGEARRGLIRQAFLADFPNAPQLRHWILPGTPERPRDTGSRGAFLAKYPNVPPDTAAVKRPWTDYLEPPFWYSKVGTSRDADWWRERPGQVVKVVAAANSSAADKAGAQYVCDGTADDIEIQAALDALPRDGGKVVLRQGTYLLDNCVMPKDDTELAILGMLKVAPATTSRLTADCPPGQNWVTVEDARKFRVGQWVTLIDATKIDHKGGWQNPAGGRKYGECSTIEKIEGNTITLRGKFGGWEEWARGPQRTPKDYQPGYTVAAQALVTTSHSAILVRGRDRVYIHGPGEIDGNKAEQQPPTAPLSTAYSSEEVLSGCGIAVQDSCFVTVHGLRIHDANLHNVTFHRSENGEIADVEAWGCNDKNILLLNTLRMRVFRNHCHDSVREDGVCLYLASHYAMLGGNRVNSNPRHGLWVNSTCLQETILPPDALPSGQP